MRERKFDLTGCRDYGVLKSWLDEARVDGLEVELVLWGRWFNGVLYHGFPRETVVEGWRPPRPDGDTHIQISLPAGLFPPTAPDEVWAPVAGAGGFRLEARGEGEAARPETAGPLAAVGTREEVRRELTALASALVEEHIDLHAKNEMNHSILLQDCTCDVARDWREVMRTRGHEL